VLRLSVAAVSVLVGVIVVLGLTGNVQAAMPFDDLCSGNRAQSVACREAQATRSQTSTNNRVLDTVKVALEFFSYVIGVTSVIVIMIAGSMYMVSGGDPAKAGRSKDTIIYASVGLVVALFAQVIVRLILDRVFP
jgi:hypothetical protein